MPQTREIRISSFLIRGHNWDITLQILKHEIAHQICWEIYHDQQSGHGQNFCKACNLLGLPERFCHSQGDLSPALEQQGGNDADEASRKVLEKIRKLLALAESSNAHESALAMKMAGRLLHRHNLQQVTEDLAHNFVYAIINRKKKRIAEYQRRIVVILKKHFDVEVLSSSLYDPASDEIHKTFELFGKQANVQTAEYCYDFLESKLSLLWEQNKHTFKGNTRIARKSYYFGILRGFSDRMMDDRDNESLPARGADLPVTSSADSVLTVTGQALRRFIRTRYPRLSSRSSGIVQIYKETYDQGIRTGRTIVLHKGIAGTDGNKGKLLEYFIDEN